MARRPEPAHQAAAALEPVLVLGRPLRCQREPPTPSRLWRRQHPDGSNPARSGDLRGTAGCRHQRPAVNPPADTAPAGDELADALVELARLAVAGTPRDPAVYIGRLSYRFRHRHPDLSGRLAAVLKDADIKFSPLRDDDTRSVAPQTPDG